VHRKVFEEFDRICRERQAGGDILEIGAMDSTDSLLRLPALRGARSKVGVDLAGGLSTCKDFQILQADANELSCFPDASFDTVLSNAVHEHDRFFWRSLAEMRRVTRPGGLIVIGVPGFTQLSGEALLGRLSRLSMLRPLIGGRAAGLVASTLCLKIHLFPGDYYRFSPQAVQEVFLEGLRDTEVRTVLTPPRIIGAGVKT
jgi:SAM-dependent methyltransferase